MKKQLAWLVNFLNLLYIVLHRQRSIFLSTLAELKFFNASVDPLQRYFFDLVDLTTRLLLGFFAIIFWGVRRRDSSWGLIAFLCFYIFRCGTCNAVKSWTRGVAELIGWQTTLASISVVHSVYVKWDIDICHHASWK